MDLTPRQRASQADLLAVAEEYDVPKGWHDHLGIEASTWSRWKSGEKAIPAQRIDQILVRLSSHPTLCARGVQTQLRGLPVVVAPNGPKVTAPLPKLRLLAQAEGGDHARAAVEVDDDAGGGDDERRQDLIRERREAEEARDAYAEIVRACDREIAGLDVRQGALGMVAGIAGPGWASRGSK